MKCDVKRCKNESEMLVTYTNGDEMLHLCRYCWEKEDLIEGDMIKYYQVNAKIRPLEIAA